MSSVGAMLGCFSDSDPNHAHIIFHFRYCVAGLIYT